MNDRFKFRVWDIKNKNFIYDAIYAYDGFEIIGNVHENKELLEDKQ